MEHIELGWGKLGAEGKRSEVERTVAECIDFESEAHNFGTEEEFESAGEVDLWHLNAVKSPDFELVGDLAVAEVDIEVDFHILDFDIEPLDNLMYYAIVQHLASSSLEDSFHGNPFQMDYHLLGFESCRFHTESLACDFEVIDLSNHKLMAFVVLLIYSQYSIQIIVIFFTFIS